MCRVQILHTSVYSPIGYPHILASVVVSSVTGTEIKNLRDKLLSVVSELKENSSRCFHHIYIKTHDSESRGQEES